jgi:hypothetical protein
MKFARIALLSAINVAAAQHLNHIHRHHARHGSPVEARDAAAVTETVPGPTVTVYELNGEDVSYNEVEEGLKEGKYVLISDTSSTVISTTTSAVPTTTSTSTPTPTPTTSSTSEVAAAEFYQEKSSSTTSTSEEPTPTPTTSATPTPTPATTSETSASSSSSSSSSSGSVGDWDDFPSGKIKCSDFDSVMKYGAINVDWLNLGGFTGIQNTPGFDFVMDSDSPIVTIETAVSGSTCTSQSFCSYACPAGYQKLQWPKAQGSTGESIGGMWCNSDNLLELTRKGVSQICGAGAGGIEVQNTLSGNVAVCRTDYPGTEAETVPQNVLPGSTDPLTNPISADYYSWQGASTTAQYYVNNQGVSESDACQWGTAGSNQGNWAPVNIGVGVGAGGITYISIFPNSPTNPDGQLNFNIKITGDVNGKCGYMNGHYYNDGVESATGCTVSL